MSVASQVARSVVSQVASAVAGASEGGAALPPNLLVNPEFAGSVTGTPGTGPTDWTALVLGGGGTLTTGAIGELTLEAAAGRYILYQGHAVVVGTYRFEVDIDVTAGSSNIYDYIFPQTVEAITYKLDDVVVAGGTVISGVHNLKLEFTVATPATTQFWLGVGLQGNNTTTAAFSNAALRKIA